VVPPRGAGGGADGVVVSAATVHRLVALRALPSHRLDYPYGVERARVTWTDERLDDFSRRMDDGFNRVGADLRAIDARIDALQRTMIQVAAAMMATFVAGFLGLIATQL
jgi:hypothetical protein